MFLLRLCPKLTFLLFTRLLCKAKSYPPLLQHLSFNLLYQLLTVNKMLCGPLIVEKKKSKIEEEKISAIKE
ncbi:hypothetical protein MANES_07G060849v8 [Manihot esculenta]|uniref:Uncharacterized protein n=1 Tax=Manihot esculenta TaxID=3983 RepID=A0ACB7HDA9_MANES|nr:hypothetical protein MANES_07G060849v8 [Manihot esculenta]